MSDKKEPGDEAAIALDDVMIAMDVVDTLRHDEAFIDRQLNSEARSADLIQRLKELYREQGIDVPDHLLAEGVQALEEGRFVYTPPEDSFQVKLAKLYVSRSEWSVKVGAVIIALFVGWFLWSNWSSQPQRIETLLTDIVSESRNPSVTARARTISAEGLKNSLAGDRKRVRSAERELEQMLRLIREEYVVRIVSGRGKKSGVHRIPKVNRSAKNYYLIVEAVDGNGSVLKREIESEEDGKKVVVKSWGIRVSQAVFEVVQKDKADDGIIQNRIVAVKSRGYLKTQNKMETLGGFITRW